MKVIILLVCTYSSYCFGAVAWDPASKTVGYGHCLSSAYPELGTFNYGQTKKVPNKCEIVRCNEGGYIIYESCDSLKSSSCLPDSDYKKPYPDCCFEKDEC